MAKYVQAPDSDTWHWCRNCSGFPQTVANETDERPGSDLCNECKAKEDAGDCSSS